MKKKTKAIKKHRNEMIEIEAKVAKMKGGKKIAKKIRAHESKERKMGC